VLFIANYTRQYYKVRFIEIEWIDASF